MAAETEDEIPKSTARTGAVPTLQFTQPEPAKKVPDWRGYGTTSAPFRLRGVSGES